MGNCKYCGKSAGFFHSIHDECEAQHFQRERITKDGKNQISAEAVHAITGSESFDDFENRIAEIAQSSSLSPLDKQMALAVGWGCAVDNLLEDGVLDDAEQNRLVEFKNRFELTQNYLDILGAWTKLTKAAVLRDVLNGVVPQRMIFDEKPPINFQKGEQIVWAFYNSKYLEDKTSRQFVGGSQGVSIRIMQGVYYRIGAFKGQAVENTERVHIDTGLVIVTNKNVYFTGQKKGIRVPYAKIVSFQPFSDGIGVMRDTATAKPQIFVTGDGWFTYNLITNLAQI